MFAFLKSLLESRLFGVKLLLVGVALGGAAAAVVLWDWTTRAQPLDAEARSERSVYCAVSGFGPIRMMRSFGHSDLYPVNECDVVVAKVVSVRGAWTEDQPATVLLQVEETLRGDVTPGLVHAVWGRTRDYSTPMCGEDQSFLRSLASRLPSRWGPSVGERFIVAGGVTPSRRWFVTHHGIREPFSAALRLQVLDQIKREAEARSSQVEVELSDRRVGAQDVVHDDELLAAVKAGKAERVRSLLRSGSRPDARNARGNSALQQAAESGRVDILQALIEAGARVETRDLGDGNQTALAVAAVSGHLEAVQLLLAHGANPNTLAWDDTPVLVQAARFGQRDVVKALLGGGAQVGLGDPNGMSALMVAAREGHPDCITVLLEAGADPNQLDTHGSRPVHYALRQAPVLKQLLQAGANPNAPDSNGHRPLRAAHGNKEATQVLLAAGAVE